MKSVFICDYIRSPIGKYAGALSGVRADDLAAKVVSELIKRNSSLDPCAIEEIWMGCANQAGDDNRNVARMAAILAGLPLSVPGVTVNRLCASGMEALISAARAVKSGDIDIAIAGGVENMTRAPLILAKSPTEWSRHTQLEDSTIGWRFINPKMREMVGVDTMPETAQNLADAYTISREDQDTFAYQSQLKTLAAQRSGRLAQEIVPIEIKRGKSSEEFSIDEHPRLSELTQLAKLRPITRPDGSVTAGNASGVNDGAAALLIASEEAVKRYNLRPMARIVAGLSCGVEPKIMGYGPVPTTQRLLQKQNLDLDDIDILEINEAFAAQVLAVLYGLGISSDDPRLNRHGGAIALGHPLGMSGSRITGSAAIDLSQTQARYALATMCVGVGIGTSILLQRV